MDCIAHRGFAGVNPENTLAAVRAAGDAADSIEVDVRRCGSGQLVVIHDETVDRVTDGTGRVADLPLATLRDLDVLGTGEGVPALRAVLEAAGVPLNLELKEQGLARDALELADEAGVTPLFSSFDPAVVEEVRERGGDGALLFVEDAEAALDRARQLDCAAVHPHVAQCGGEFVVAAQAAGLAVNAWTVRSRETGARLAEVGVDGAIADAPACC